MADRRPLAINGGLPVELPAGDRLIALSPTPAYGSLLDCTASHIAGRAAGLYVLPQGAPAIPTGVGSLAAPNIIYLDAADYPTIGTLAPKLRIRALLFVNDVAPTGNYTFGLHPITRPATSGGAGLGIYTIGAAVAGTLTSVITAPAADSMNTVMSADFDVPAAGYYALGFTATIIPVASSHLHISALLQMRYA